MRSRLAPAVRPLLATAALATVALAGCYESHVLGGADASPDGSPDAGPRPDAPTDAPPRSDAGPDPCLSNDLDTWTPRHLNAGGDWRRAVAALSNVPWVAMRESEGNVVIARLEVDESGIVFAERHDVPESPVYPLALDVDPDARRAVLVTTTNNNWHGEAELWWVDLDSDEVRRADWSALGPDSTYTIRGDLGFVGDHIALAGSRAEMTGTTVERRDERLESVEGLNRPDDLSPTAVRTAPDVVDFYFLPAEHYRVTADGIEEPPGGGGDDVLGGMYDYLVFADSSEIVLQDGARRWAAEWPHTQISHRTVLRLSDDERRRAFVLQTELTAVVGHVLDDHGGTLQWLRIDRAPSASGLGVGLLPVTEPGRLGLFYIGLEIPRPEQPLRYFGIECPRGGRGDGG